MPSFVVRFRTMAMELRGSNVLLLVFLFVLPKLVSATPFPVPGRPLQNRHKQMRVNNASTSAQTQGRLFSTTTSTETSFTVSHALTLFRFLASVFWASVLHSLVDHQWSSFSEVASKFIARIDHP